MHSQEILTSNGTQPSTRVKDHGTISEIQDTEEEIVDGETIIQIIIIMGGKTTEEEEITEDGGKRTIGVIITKVGVVAMDGGMKTVGAEIKDLRGNLVMMVGAILTEMDGEIQEETLEETLEDGDRWEIIPTVTTDGAVVIMMAGETKITMDGDLISLSTTYL